MKRRKPKRIITDETPVRLRELAQYMGMGKTTIYRDVSAGYVFEFLRHKMTTPGHYKAWLRSQTSQESERDAQLSQAEQERQQRELHHLRSAAGRSHAPRSNRDSQTPLLPRAKSSGSAQLA